MCREEFEKELATARSEHESVLSAAKEEQARIQKEIELLKSTGEEERTALKTQYEHLVQEVKEHEKVGIQYVFESVS